MANGGRRPSLSGEGSFTLLKTLNTFTQRYQLYVRVVDRSPLTEFTNKRTSGTGHIFNATILDSEGVCMSCKFWNAAAEKYSTVIEKGTLLKMSNPGRIIVANKRYSTIDHNYEISIDNKDANIEICAAASGEADAADATELPALPQAPILAACRFQNLRTIFLNTSKLPYIGAAVGIIHDVQPLRSVQVRRATTPSSTDSATTSVRNMVIVDPTRHAIEITLWGDACESHPYVVGDVVYFTALQFKASTRGTGIQASTVRNSEIYLNNEEHPSTAQFKSWYESEGLTAEYKFLSDTTSTGDGANRQVIETSLRGLQEHMQSEDLQPAEAMAGIMFKINAAFVTDIVYKRRDDPEKYSIIYNACVTCNKKMVESDRPTCPSCNGDSSIPKFSVIISLADHSASNFEARCFTDQAQSILVRQPRQVMELIEAGRTKILADILEYKALWKRFNFVIRARREVYNTQERTSLVVASLQPINHNTQISRTMKMITELLPDAFESRSEDVPDSERVTSDAKRQKVTV